MASQKRRHPDSTSQLIKIQKQLLFFPAISRTPFFAKFF
jgi:hypothetical protein